MGIVLPATETSRQIRDFILRGFEPDFDRPGPQFGSHPLWEKLRGLGTEIWLDTGSIESAKELWTAQMSALTTNNSLLNREVQTGVYDQLIAEADEMLRDFDLSPAERKLEICFILNARHGLRLVAEFDAFVSVELHTDLSHDLDGTVAHALRYDELCPERFVIKVPLTASGVLATRRIGQCGIPVNHTLGFSARQNYVVTRLGRPAFVNVFMGRLNAVVADNQLGTGEYVGERATLASQRVVTELRDQLGVRTRLIGASFRSGRQVRDLAGIDVMTIPPKVAGEFCGLGVAPEDLVDQTAQDYTPPLADGVDPAAIGLDTLWDVGPRVIDCVEAAEKEDLDTFASEDLKRIFADNGGGDLLVDWSDADIAASAAEGKIPSPQAWQDRLASGTIGLDSLMNLAGLNAFVKDQAAMDERVASVLAGRKR